MKQARAAGTVLLTLLLVAACAPEKTDVPPELLGRWTTEDTGFAGRAMNFTLDSVTFETGEAAPERHSVVAVEGGPLAPDAQDIFIVYEGEGGNEFRLALSYDSAAHDLRLVNRFDVIWTKDEEQ